MTDYELDCLESEANKVLYRVDPDFARELGYEPPTPLDPRTSQMLAGMQQAPPSMLQQLATQQQQQMMGQTPFGYGMFGFMGGSLGQLLGLKT